MANYRVMVVLHTTDNVAANYVVNTWHFNADSDAILPTIETSIIAYYNAVRPYLSPLIRLDEHELKWYNMVDVEPRAPVRTTIWALTNAPSGTALPPEVALCMSFQGLKLSGLPQARRRGRVFIGPLSSNTLGTGGRPDDSVVTGMRGAGQALLDDSDAATTWRWQIFSRLNDGFIDVTDGWVDNEYDTQRRRGRPYTFRSTFT